MADFVSILIHVGFALSSITEEEAAMALASLEMMGESFDGDVSALVGSGVSYDLGEADPFPVSNDLASATEP